MLRERPFDSGVFLLTNHRLELRTNCAKSIMDGGLFLTNPAKWRASFRLSNNLSQKIADALPCGTRIFFLHFCTPAWRSCSRGDRRDLWGNFFIRFQSAKAATRRTLQKREKTK